MPKSVLRWRVPLGFLFAAWYVIVARPGSLPILILAILLVVLGCALRSWAAGFLFKGKRVAVGGPYAYVRNPLYVGSFIIGLGFCAALWQKPLPWRVASLWILFGLGFGLVYRAKTLAEERELQQNLGEEYVNYQSKVPAFLPFYGKAKGLSSQTFSAELYRRNREYQCLLGSFAIIILLIVKFCAVP